MEVLLTIEEYRERATNLVLDIAKSVINPTADDWVKYTTIRTFAEKVFHDDFQCIDQVNQLFIKCFSYDRNGKRLNSTNISKIGRKEADEFNSQEWYVKEYDKAHKNWELARCWGLKISPYKYMGKNTIARRITIEDVVSFPFKDDCNEIYHLTEEVFKRLYGYNFEYDRNYKA